MPGHTGGASVTPCGNVIVASREKIEASFSSRDNEFVALRDNNGASVTLRDNAAGAEKEKCSFSLRMLTPDAERSNSFFKLKHFSVFFEF